MKLKSKPQFTFNYGVYQHQQKVEEKISTNNSFPPTRKPVVWLRMALL